MKNIDILIVEDERIIAEDIKMMLQNMGYGVCGIASSSDEAVALDRNLTPDLILMDIRLNGPVDGIETAEIIHKERDVPIIYVTAYADEQTIQRAKITGPYGYVLKPIRTNELNSAIEIGQYKFYMEKKLNEVKLRGEREKLETIQQLAGAVAHEFNQPLQALMIISEILPDAEEIDITDLSLRISEQVARMSELVSRLENLDSINTKTYVGSSKILDLYKKIDNPARNRKILIIDDDKTILRLLSRIIKKEGFEVDTANSVKDGSAYLNKNSYGLIICDLQLPKGSGISIFEKTYKKNLDTPFVFISGYAVDELSKEILERSAGFLAKPFSVKDVSNLLKNIFRY